MTVARGRSSSQSSTTYGYVAGGYPNTNVIDKWAFGSDGDASDVGNLTGTEQQVAGQHF